MTVVEINVVVDAVFTEPASFLRFRADEDESFWDALSGAASADGIDIGGITGLSMVLEHHDAEMTFFIVMPGDRVGDISALMGQDLDADPPLVRVTAGGFGGAGEALYELWDIAQALATLGGASGVVYWVTRKSRAAALARLYAEERRAAEDFLASSGAQDAMVGLLRSKPFWRLNEVITRFGLTPDHARDALRVAGFDYVRASDGSPIFLRAAYPGTLAGA